MPGRDRRTAARRLIDLVGNAYAFDGLDEFRAGILPLLREAVPANRVSYNEFGDPPDETWWISDPFVDIEPAAAERFRALAHENPILAHTRRTGDGRPRRISDFLSREEYHRLALYREFYRDVGCETQVAFTLPSRPPVVVGMALVRDAEDFSDAECALLGAARPHLIQAYRAAELSSVRSAALVALEAGLDAVAAPLIVADGHGRVAMATPAARDLLRTRLGGQRPAARLPQALRDALAQRRAHGTPAAEPLVLTLGAGEPLTVRVLPEAGGEGMTLLVFEDGLGGLDRAALEGLGLTPREAEALRWIALGRRGPDAARLMGISPRTVEKHLQHVYAKLGVRTGSEAAATAWAAVGVRRPAIRGSHVEGAEPSS